MQNLSSSATISETPTVAIPTAAADAERPLSEQVRAATEILELMAADWRLLDQLPPDVRQRLHRAVAGLSVPDRRARRKRSKAANGEQRTRVIRREDAVLNATGIRV